MTPEDYQAIELQKSDQVVELLESRNILDDEIQMVIHNAENTGEKLYQTENDRLLAKLRIGEVTFYAVYSPVEGKTYTVHTAYSHRTALEE